MNKKGFLLIGILAIFLAIINLGGVSAGSCIAIDQGGFCELGVNSCGQCEVPNVQGSPGSCSCTCSYTFAAPECQEEPNEDNPQYPGGCPADQCYSSQGLQTYHDWEDQGFLGCVDHYATCTQSLQCQFSAQCYQSLICVRSLSSPSNWAWRVWLNLTEAPTKLLSAQCNDGYDNDCDTLVDMDDPDCCDDADGDNYNTTSGGACGIPSDIDCDETNYQINPGATEICDGIDNNCNSQIDEGGVCAGVCVDLDNDDYNTTAGGNCGIPSDIDCNDGNPAINPGMAEICTSTEGVDNDCDTFIDCRDTDCSGNASAGCCVASESGAWPDGVSYCADGIDNDCNNEKDWDYQVWYNGSALGLGVPGAVEDGIKGDNQCKVGFSPTGSFFQGGIHVNDTSPVENTIVQVMCQSTVDRISSIEVKIGSFPCSFFAWGPAFFKIGIFRCNAGLPGIKNITCSINQSESYNSTPSVIETINVLPSSGGCLLGDVYWNGPDFRVSNGTTAGLTVEGTNCDGEDVNLTIYEDDDFSGTSLPISQPSTRTITISGTSAFGSWRAEYQEDGAGGSEDPPEYYISATLVSDGSETIDSETLGNDLLEVTPPGSDDISICDDYGIGQCDDDPYNVGVFTGSWEIYNDTYVCERRVNGTGCSWNAGEQKCEQETQYQYHPDNPLACPVTSLTCTYSQTKQECTADVDFFEVTFTSTDPNCELASRTLECPSRIELPFFGWFNVVSVIIIIGIIYFIFNRKKKVDKIAIKC